MEHFLSDTEQRILKEAHLAAREKRHADRIKTILLLNDGWSYEQIAKALLLDDATLRRYLALYQAEGLDALVENHYKGRSSKLTEEECAQLKTHLEQTVYTSAKPIIAYLQEHFGITYTPEGLVHLLHRLGFVYKKTKAVPGKADPQRQKAFLERYEKLKEQKGPNDRIYFMDGTHPHHNSMPAYGWIPKGETKEIRSRSGTLSEIR